MKERERRKKNRWKKIKEGNRRIHMREDQHPVRTIERTSRSMSK
jgi:hypothetical protein